MIPKRIHYCWFGGAPLPSKAKKCIASWKKFCPDYEIVRWDESNFDLQQNDYVQWCYAHQKWAFLSDYARLAIVAEQGGVYLDTDVELVKSLDHLLTQPAFYSFENNESINTGQGFGALAHHETVEAMKACYEDLDPETVRPCPYYNTLALVQLGLEPNGQMQTVAGAAILPADYMNPYDDPTGRLNKTENTVSIHWYSKSWISPGLRLRSKLTRPLHRLFGKDCFRRKG